MMGYLLFYAIIILLYYVFIIRRMRKQYQLIEQLDDFSDQEKAILRQQWKVEKFQSFIFPPVLILLWYFESRQLISGLLFFLIVVLFITPGWIYITTSYITNQVAIMRSRRTSKEEAVRGQKVMVLGILLLIMLATAYIIIFVKLVTTK